MCQPAIGGRTRGNVAGDDRSEYIDVLGRVVRTIDRNHDGTSAQDVEMHYHFDIREEPA